jgi:DNA-binding response OmpR family regulator
MAGVPRDEGHPTLGSSIRVIMVTALQDWMNKRQALETGADDFVEKPFELAALAKVVERNAARLPPHELSFAELPQLFRAAQEKVPTVSAR